MLTTLVHHAATTQTNRNSSKHSTLEGECQTDTDSGLDAVASVTNEHVCLLFLQHFFFFFFLYRAAAACTTVTPDHRNLTIVF